MSANLEKEFRESPGMPDVETHIRPLVEEYRLVLDELISGFHGRTEPPVRYRDREGVTA